MDDEPKISFPVIRNGKQSVVAPSQSITTSASVEPSIKYPTMKETVSADSQAAKARLRGLTFGLSDRIEALVKPGKYKDNLDKQLSERDQYASDHPWSNVGNNLIGGLASGGAVSSGVKALGAKVLPSVAKYAQGVGVGPLATRLGQVTGEGALYGETAEQAQKPHGKVGEDLGEGALFGAGASLGAVAGIKVAKSAIKGMSRVGQRVALAMGAVKPEDFATRKYIESLAAQGLEPEEITAAMKYLRGDDLAQHGPVSPRHTLPNLATPVTVADVAPRTTLNTFAKGVKSSDKAAADVSDALANRNAEQGMRLQNHIGETLSPNMDSTAVRDELIAQRKLAADPHYREAYAVGAPDDPIVDQWINDRGVNGKLVNALEKNLEENASKTGLGEGKPIIAKLAMDPDGNYVWKQRPTIEDLDTIKKHIDSKLKDLWNPTKGQYNLPRQTGDADASQLSNQRDDLVRMIEQLTPDGKGGSHYANARKSFADDSELIDAHRSGQSVMRTRPEDVLKEFQSFSGRPELENQYRAGIASVVKDLIDKSDSGGGAAIVRKLYGSPGIQQKIEAVMADPTSNAQFSRNMAAEKAFVDTQKNLAPKSSGTDLLGDAEGFSLPLAAANALTGRFGAAANQMGRFGTGAISGMAPEVGEDLSRIAMLSPEEHADWVRAYRAQQNTPTQKVKKMIGALSQYTGNSVPAAAAVSGGLLPKTSSYGSEEDYLNTP